MVFKMQLQPLPSFFLKYAGDLHIFILRRKKSHNRPYLGETGQNFPDWVTALVHDGAQHPDMPSDNWCYAGRTASHQASPQNLILNFQLKS